MKASKFKDTDSKLNTTINFEMVKQKYRRLDFSQLSPEGKLRRVKETAREVFGTIWVGAKMLAIFASAWLYVCACLSIEL